MIRYLSLSLFVSTLFWLFIRILSRFRNIPNRLHMAALSAALFKSLIPWAFIPLGFISLPKTAEMPLRALGIQNRGMEEILNTGLPGLSAPDPSTAAGALTFGILSLDSLILLLWMAGACICCLGSVLSLLRLKRRIVATAAAEDGESAAFVHNLAQKAGIRKPIAILRTGAVQLPLLLWMGTWAIVLPNSFCVLSREDKKAVLAHELIHIRRGDYIKYLFLGLLKSIYFFSPPIRGMVHELLAREEIETDRRAIELLDTEAARYGSAILNIHSVAASDKPYTVPAFGETNIRSMKMRIEALFEKKKLSRIFAATAAVCISLVLSVLPIKAETRDTGEVKNLDSASSSMETLSMRSPVAGASISLDYQVTISHPYTKKPYTHQGVDLTAPLGTPVTAAGVGRVLETGFDTEKGNYIILDHGGGLTSLYSHLKEILVQPNQELTLGNKIGLLGNTGISTGPHVHFQMELKGVIVNPHDYMNL